MVFRAAVLLGCAAAASAFQAEQKQETSLPLSVAGKKLSWTNPIVENNLDLPQHHDVQVGTNSNTEDDECYKPGGVEKECTIGAGPKDKRLSMWRCGSSTGANNIDDNAKWATYNPYAGIEMLKGEDGHKSLDWVREVEADEWKEDGVLRTAAGTDRKAAQESSFDSLFCADYLRRYLNPRNDAPTGVCLRDIRQGRRWAAIMAADSDAHMYWDRFGNNKGNPNIPLHSRYGGYQKSTPLHRLTTNSSMNSRWGSGGIGSVPANWCGSYMKQMLCHVAFPQYSGTGPAKSQATTWNYCKSTATATTGSTANGPTSVCPSNGALVRPVCGASCTTLFNVCNRYEAKYCSLSPASNSGPCEVAFAEMQPAYTGNPAGVLPYMATWSGTCQQAEKGDSMRGADCMTPRVYKENNELWCQFWNRGFGLAQAGVGVGFGPDESAPGPDGSGRFCATWESGPRNSPMLLLSIIVAAVGTIMSFV